VQRRLTRQRYSLKLTMGFLMISGARSAALAGALLLIGEPAAWAQGAPSNTASQANMNTGMQSEWGQSSPGGKITTDTQQKIRQSLEQSGFKDIRVVPESFVVHAQAPDGSRNVMLLSPEEVSGVVMSNASQGGQGTSSQVWPGQVGSQPGTRNAPNTTQQKLSRYGYTNLQDFTPMRGWVAEATKNGEHVHVMLSDNGLVATFPGR
jgi:hypothetical protein